MQKEGTDTRRLPHGLLSKLFDVLRPDLAAGKKGPTVRWLPTTILVV